VPRQFLQLAERVWSHRSPERASVLYRVLFRLCSGERTLLSDVSDPDVARLIRYDREVSKDEQRMHAFVRFRPLAGSDGVTRHIAWYAPEHRVLRGAALFFLRRFRDMEWAILTPDESVYHSTGELTFGPGVPRDEAPAEDALDDLFRTYFAAAFDPNRVNPTLQRRHLPLRVLQALPEVRESQALVRSAPARNAAFAAHSAALIRTTDFIPASPDLSVIREASGRCRGCELHRAATQTVFGEGPADAKLIVIGEQPGDLEDVAGRPFVGPAGDVLTYAFDRAGIVREKVYVTNAVKHFHFEQRGKARIHQRPKAGHVHACRPWLEAELDLVRPRVIVCLGATAARALFGNTFRLTSLRGQVFATAWAPVALATWHPANILRATPEIAERLTVELVSDLKLGAEHASDDEQCA
jgi:DNA polymerase